MLIVCDNCGAEYQVDIDTEDEGGAARQQRFRCSACGHTFTIAGDSAASGDSTPAPSAPAGSESAGVMYLQQEGKVYQIDDLATLQRWIVERRVLREDLISLGGLKWESIGSRRDLQVFFHLIEHAERSVISGQGSMPPPLGESSSRDELAGRAPWEMGPGGEAPGGGSDGPSSLPPDTDELAAGEPDPDELDNDDGTDAGLPVVDLDVLARTVPSMGELTDAPEPAFARPLTVPNLAGPSLDASPPPSSPGPVPLQEPEVGPALSADMLFPDETEEMPQKVRRHYPEPEPPAPPKDGVPVWAIVAGVAVVLALGGWWWTTQREVPSVSAPPPASTAVIAPPELAPASATSSPAGQAPVATEGTSPPEEAAPAVPPVEPAPPGQPPPPTPAASTAASAPPPAEPARTAEPARSAEPAASPPAQAAPAEPKRMSTSARIKAGWAAADKGRYDEAQAQFAAAVESSPGNGAAVFGLGYSYEKLGNSSLAVRYYCTASRSSDSEAQLEAQGRLRALGVNCE